MSVSLVRVLAAAQEGIDGQISVQRGLELGLEITAGDSTQDLPVCVRQSRVAGPAATATFLEQIFTDTHAYHCASGVCHRVQHLGHHPSFFSRPPLLCGCGGGVARSLMAAAGGTDALASLGCPGAPAAALRAVLGLPWKIR